MDISNTLKYVKQNNFHFSKKYGQNFLVDDGIASKIITEVKKNKFDSIIEIGSGLGALTERLLEFKQAIFGIEFDKRLFSFLNKKFSNNSNLMLINDDALDVDFENIAKKFKDTIIVANLPYSITTPFIIKFLNTKSIKKMICMLQKEFVEKILNFKCQKKHGAFSALINYYATCTKLFNVSKMSFYPVPKVDSTFIDITKNNKLFDVNFFKFLRRVFQNKRKNLSNNLRSFLSKESINHLYEKFNFSPNLRVEELDNDVLYEMYKHFNP